MRKMASIQLIDDVVSIPNADKIEVVRVGGWAVVVQKGEFKVGDECVYFETDTLLPESNPVFESFQCRGQKTAVHEGQDVKGHVLRTIKLRGQISQGLVLSLSKAGVNISDVRVGDDVTELLGVFKYEAPIKIGSSIIGDFDTKYCPKTDSERVQNLTEHWDEILSLKWVPTVKIDGTSTTIVKEDDKIRVFSRNCELDPVDSAQLECATQHGFINEMSNGMAIQFEMCGPGIQQNRAKLSRTTAFVFAVWLNGSKLDRTEWPESCLQNAAPILSDEWLPSTTVDDLINKVATLRGGITKDILDEGIVYHLAAGQKKPLWMDRNGSFKCINNKFLLKHGL